jgi:hypothetical protein
MKICFTFLLLLCLLAANDPINSIEKIIVCPNFIIFKSALEDDHWTIQTLSRNFDVYKLSVSGLKDSTSKAYSKEVDYYSNPGVKFYFSRWRSGLEPSEADISQLPSFNRENEWGIKDKISMIAFLNRKEYGFIEKFFTTTFTVGNTVISTTLEKPVNVIDYKRGEYLYYQDLGTVYGVYPNGQYSVSKSNFSWAYKNQKLQLTPSIDYVKNRVISAINPDERKWYNIQWEKLHKANKITASLSSSGISWNTANLDEKEKNLMQWFQKK